MAMRKMKATSASTTDFLLFPLIVDAIQVTYLTCVHLHKHLFQRLLSRVYPKPLLKILMTLHLLRKIMTDSQKESDIERVCCHERRQVYQEQRLTVELVEKEEVDGTSSRLFPLDQVPFQWLHP